MKNMGQMEPSRTTELLKELFDKMEKVLRSLHMWEDFTYLTPIHHTQCDDFDEHIGLDDGGLEITTCVDKKNREWFCCGHIVYDPGVRYHADGSGTPPSEDFVEDTFVKADDTLQAAEDILRWAFGMLMTDRMDDLKEIAAHDSDENDAIEHDGDSILEDD